MLFHSLKKKHKYYNPISFINNYDNEIIDVRIQRDAPELF